MRGSHARSSDRVRSRHSGVASAGPKERTYAVSCPGADSDLWNGGGAPPLEDEPQRRQHRHRGEQAAHLADHGDRPEAADAAVVRAEEREVPERRREAAEDHRAARRAERAEDVAAPVGPVALHDVDRVVDADAERDRERGEVQEVDLHVGGIEKHGLARDPDEEREEHA